MSTIIPLPKSREFIESVEKEVIFSGGYGASKSVSLCLKAVFLALRYPHNRIFIGRKTLQDFKATTYKTLLDGDGDLPPILPKQYIVSHNKTDRNIVLINGSELVYGPVEIESIKSLNLGAAAIDECGELTEEEWDALNGRQRLAGIPVHQVFGSTNPYSEYHWIWNRFVLNPLRNKYNQPITKIIQMATYENTYLPEEYIDHLRTTLFGFYYQRYVEGKWVGADTLVYDNFDPKIHVIRNFEIPSSWKRYRAIDFGYRAPYSCGWFAVCPERMDIITSDGTKDYLEKNDVILYKEIYFTERTSTINAERVKLVSDNEKIEWTVCDWDAGDRADHEAVGIRTVKAEKKDKSGRLQKVRQRLGNSNPGRGQLVRPTFRIFENSLDELDRKIKFNFETGEKNNDPVRASEEFMAYSWKPSKAGDIKDEPLDKFDHAMDMICYFFTKYQDTPQWKDIDFDTLSLRNPVPQSPAIPPSLFPQN